MSGIVEILGMTLIQRMIIAGILSSLACGIIGTIIVVRRSVFIAGGISHSTFGGVGFAYLLQTWGVGWFDPVLGALLFAFGASIILSSEYIKSRMREDSTIGVLWVMGMALGVLFMTFVDRTRISVLSYESILFGNIVFISRLDLYIMGAVVLLIYLFTTIFYNDLEILTFDETFARISGIRVKVMNLILMVLVAMTITLLIKIVGVVLIIAMLTIPAATANLFTKKLSMMMITATVIGSVLTLAGIGLSILLDIPSGTTIVLFQGIAFLLTLAGKSIYNRFRIQVVTD
ncbi:MAG: metal ABC transporter permease [Thermoplasmatota archaeon]